MNKERFLRLLNERILILDGGMGTMIQSFKLNEQDYRGERFADFPGQLKGNNDLLCITRPDVIQSIHRQYLDAGADIFATNTFNANAISMADYAMEAYVREINLAAGRLSREVADTYMAEHPDRTIFVAGSIGPTNKTASMSPDVSDPAYRAVTYKDLYNAYKEQVEGLVDGGVDIILFETTFDTLNVKAGLEAAEVVLKEKEKDLPIMLSLTLSAQGGRTFSGQTLLAFLASIQHTHIVSVGLNCSFGAADMKPYLQELAKYAPYYISAYPNAGLPNSFGTYDETPDKMAQHVKPFVEEGLVNIIGGCCGTTPAHISRYPELVKGAKPHIPALKPDCLWLSGLELLEVKPENNFVNVGERCNVAGSRKFLRLIKEGSYEEALTIARKQVEDGAQVIDINMDDGMLDAVKEMKTFLNLIASEPDIARVPVMIDSSKWEVIEEGLMCVQGKSIVNSISLKEGEEVFLKHAARIKQLGAAAVVMAFDEKGQADTYERKIEICERAYRLLIEKIDFNLQDIIFDPNVLAIATGMEEHNGYGLAFIRAVEWIKKNLPGAKVSGGVSNLSFSFRGNNHVREAMHSVFLYHAIQQSLYHVEKGNKKFLLPWLIKNLQPPVVNALVFSRTKHGADKIARDLTKQGIPAAAIHGNKSQTARVTALEDFKAGKTRVLVATDIAARGIDISELSHVFNYDLPEVPETYVHRIGRTARAGADGTAVSFCAPEEQEYLAGIEKLNRRKIPVVSGHPWDGVPAPVRPEPPVRGKKPKAAPEQAGKQPEQQAKPAKAAAPAKPEKKAAAVPKAQAKQPVKPEKEERTMDDPKRTSGGRSNDRRSNNNNNSRPRREQNAPARGSNAQPKFDPHFVSAPEATPLRSARKAPAAPAAPAIKTAQGAQAVQGQNAPNGDRRNAARRSDRNTPNDRNARPAAAGGAGRAPRSERNERTGSPRSAAGGAGRAPKADTGRRSRQPAAKDEDPGLVLISRRPPQQKFTNFEEYMNAHGGATAPIEDHSDEV